MRNVNPCNSTPMLVLNTQRCLCRYIHIRSPLFPGGTDPNKGEMGYVRWDLDKCSVYTQHKKEESHYNLCAVKQDLPKPLKKWCHAEYGSPCANI